MGYYYGIGGEFYLIAIALLHLRIVSQRLNPNSEPIQKFNCAMVFQAQIAEKMLADHGIRDVKVVSVKGMLTDHYNPMKTVNLSESVQRTQRCRRCCCCARMWSCHTTRLLQSKMICRVQWLRCLQRRCGSSLLVWACLVEPELYYCKLA